MELSFERGLAMEYNMHAPDDLPDVMGGELAMITAVDIRTGPIPCGHDARCGVALLLIHK